MPQVTPYNLIVVVSVAIMVITGAVVLILRDVTTAASYAAFASPVLIALVGWLVGAQNAQNHAQNVARLDDLEQKVSK